MAQRHTFTFGLGKIAGNISELGVQFLSSGSLHSRALVEDSQGQPATITVTSDEQLVITYTLRAEASADDVVQTVPMMINGEATNTEVTCRWKTLSAIDITGMRTYIYNYAGYGTLNAAFEVQNYTDYDTASISQTPTTGGRRIVLTFSASRANFQRMIEIASIDVAKFQFVPPIPKNSGRTLSLSIDFIFGRI